MPDWLSRQLEFQGFSPWWAAASHLTAVVIAAGLILTLNRYERQLVSRSVGFGLLALRLGVLALILLTFLQPVQSWTINESLAGRIVVGFDQSQSMQSKDVHASRAEKLRWARGLGMIGHAGQEEQLDAWQAAFDRREEPAWATEDEIANPAEREKTAAARKENLLGLFRELQELSRIEIARRLYSATADPLNKELEKIAKVELQVFAGKTEPVDFEQLEAVLAEPSAAVNVEATDLGTVLRAAPAQTSAAPILGVVLFTDGRQTSSQSPLSAAVALGQLKAPIYPVLLGTAQRPKDLAFPSLDAPPSVYRGDEPVAKVLLQTAGFEGVPLEIELQSMDEETVATVEKKNITPTGPLTPLEFKLPKAELGRHSYLVKVPVQEGETHEDNNSRAFTIAVVDDRARVLLVESDPRWEFRYLETAFARDERIELKTVLFQQPYLGLLPETYFPRKLPATQPSPFAELEVVILGDVAPWHLADEHWQHLEKFVSEEGGTLVLSAGKNSLPMAYKSPALDRLSPMAKLNRWSIDDAAAQVPPSRRGFRLQLTPEAMNQTMFHFAEDRDENRAVWSQLPGPVWAWVGEAKPAATVWTAAFLPELAGLMDERKHALIAHQHFGFGQVVWIGFDGTWRWRHRVGDKYHHQFWGQLVRWAVSNKISAGNEFVRFGAERSDVPAGEDVVLRTRWSPPFLQKYPKLSARAEISKISDAADDVFATVDLPFKPDQPLLRDGKAVNLPAGEYRAKLVVKDGDLGPKGVETTFVIRTPSTPELVDTTANRELLAQLAEASGGQLLLADEVKNLPNLLRPENTTQDIYRETPLWDHGAMLGLFFLLLTLEWFLRKWNGLP